VSVVHYDDRQLGATPDVVAPDGSDVRVLATSSRGSMAHFTLAAGQCSAAVRHRTVEELWFVVDGTGEMWRRHGDDEVVTHLQRGASLAIPVGTAFQFRAANGAALQIVGVTMPPWPGDDEAIVVEGRWPPSAGPATM
jgi:mannose-6-phosphate isomerase-like protein (cupin superfamily)